MFLLKILYLKQTTTEHCVKVLTIGVSLQSLPLNKKDVSLSFTHSSRLVDNLQCVDGVVVSLKQSTTLFYCL